MTRLTAHDVDPEVLQLFDGQVQAGLEPHGRVFQNKARVNGGHAAVASYSKGCHELT